MPEKKSKEEEMEQAIIDCWYWLKPKPRTHPTYINTRMRNEELIQNQEELITVLRDILEPIIKIIKFDEDGVADTLNKDM